jgi:hypothetical protein
MKRILFLMTYIIITLNCVAQAPQKMSYQAVIRNASNALVSNAPVKMRISILQGSTSGTTVYSEFHSATTNANGLVSIEIGAGTSPTGTFSSINWGNGTFYLKTETDPNNGNDYTITGTSQFLSVPYALHAKTAESIVGGGSNNGGFTHYIGEQFGGGVIFHLWKDAQGVEHGLIVALTDQSTETAWSNVTSMIGASAQSNWDGLANSNAIVAQAGHTSSAAKLCLDLVSGGQSDWYLPATDELSLLWDNRFNVNKTLSTISGATTVSDFFYWSSTELNIDAWVFSFFKFEQHAKYSLSGKKNTLYVRAVRPF